MVTIRTQTTKGERVNNLVAEVFEVATIALVSIMCVLTLAAMIQSPLLL